MSETTTQSVFKHDEEQINLSCGISDERAHEMQEEFAAKFKQAGRNDSPSRALELTVELFGSNPAELVFWSYIIGYNSAAAQILGGQNHGS